MEELYQLFPFSGYRVLHLKLREDSQAVRVYLDRSATKPLLCMKCGSPLKNIRGRQRRAIEDLRMLEKRTYIHFTQLKGRCPQCRKVRLEAVDFIAHETPHLTRRYAFLLGQFCEISQASRVAEVMGHGKMTLWRADLERMQRFFSHYKVPDNLTHISVDEVYARARHDEEENRNDRFFTVITNLDNHKVVWVEDSRRKEALDSFFKTLGTERCQLLKVVATDQHDDYSRSIAENCPEAVQVFDRFHLMKAFEEAVNETRKRLYKMLPQKEVREWARPKYRFIFLKAAANRSESEKSHMEKVMKDNEAFMRLELIKERMLTFFNQKSAEEARKVFLELREWIWEAGFPDLKKWWQKLASVWSTVANYFTFRVTTAVSEGINNVIKSIKRGAFGFRNMQYFKLKILQRCGLLNSQFMTDQGQWTPKAKALYGLG